MAPMIYLGHLLVVLALAATPAAASPDHRPEIRARAFLEAMALRDWQGAAAHYHPSSSAKLKSTLWPVIEREVNCGHQGFFHTVVGKETPYSAVALEDSRPFAGALLGQLMHQAAGAGLFLGAGHVVGSIAEGPDLTHVLIRSEVGTQAFMVTRMQVLTFTRSGESDPWGMWVGAELESYAYRLRQSFQPECKRQ